METGNWWLPTERARPAVVTVDISEEQPERQLGQNTPGGTSVTSPSSKWGIELCTLKQGLQVL